MHGLGALYLPVFTLPAINPLGVTACRHRNQARMRSGGLSAFRRRAKAVALGRLLTQAIGVDFLSCPLRWEAMVWSAGIPLMSSRCSFSQFAAATRNGSNSVAVRLANQ